jgi:hypothetical protein
MNPPCIRRTQRWLRFLKNEKKEIKGTLTLLSVFLFVIFSTLGLGMLYLTQVYLKTSAYRKNVMLLEYASENGIKQGYDHLHGLLSQAASPILLSETELSGLLNDSLDGGNAAAQKILGCGFPSSLRGSWERLAWESITDFQLLSMREEPGYFLAQYRGRIASTGLLQGFKTKKASFLDSELGVLAGYIPLPAIPFLLDKSMTPGQKGAFLEDNDIHMIPPDQSPLPVPFAFSDGELLPKQAMQPLAKALKIEIFHPQDLSASKLRLALGLDVANDPVPDGVYLIQDDLGLGGVFVQGDLDEMILAIQGNTQIISFRKNQDTWILRFSPAEGRTSFIGPGESLSFDQIPVGIIIVNGKIFSLGGGYDDGSGRILMAVEEELPCVLNGVSLTIISSDEITLTSHLIYEGVRWMDGVPYVKDSDSQLVIHAAGQDFVEGEEKAGRINIDESSPEQLKIHASLTASGEGIAVHGKDKEIQLLGSVQTSELSLNGNEISIKFDERSFHSSADLFENVPRTEKPVLNIFFFRILNWRENV